MENNPSIRMKKMAIEVRYIVIFLLSITPDMPAYNGNKNSDGLDTKPVKTATKKRASQSRKTWKKVRRAYLDKFDVFLLMTKNIEL